MRRRRAGISEHKDERGERKYKGSYTEEKNKRVKSFKFVDGESGLEADIMWGRREVVLVTA